MQLLGDGDIADICRLTCLEQATQIVEDTRFPALEIRGLKVILRIGEKNGD